MFFTNLDQECYEDIWHAPEGNDYAIQFKRDGEREWSILDYAVSKPTAIELYNDTVVDGFSGTEYRLVRLSRYPPCSVQQILKSHKAKS